MAAQFEVGGRDFSDQTDADIPHIFGRGLQVGSGGLHIAPGSPKDVRLPRRVEVQIEKIVGLSALAETGAGFTGLAAHGSPAGTHLREEVSAGNGPGRLGFGHAAGGDFQILIGVNRAGDQTIEFGLIEFSPPSRDIAGVGQIRSRSGQRFGDIPRKGGLIVRTNGARNKERKREQRQARGNIHKLGRG